MRFPGTTSVRACVAVASVLLPLGTPQAHATAIGADATGYDAGFVPEFWGVQFLSGTGHIQEVTFNLGSGYFDFDGSPFLNNTFPPGIPGVQPVLGAMSGLSTGDITSSTVGGLPIDHPTSLTFTFTPGSFIAGDWFSFSADVDGAGVAQEAGGTFGALGASFAVLMSSGELLSAPFVTITDNRSEAFIGSPPSSVP
jgi:hypothetical protein